MESKYMNYFPRIGAGKPIEYQFQKSCVNYWTANDRQYPNINGG